MPQHYTVPTKNAFAALDDSDAEDAILSKPDETPLPQGPPPREVENKPRRRPQQQDRPPRQRAPREETAIESPAPAGDENHQVRATRARGGPRTSLRPVREGQREYDRQSGTGRGREMKKSGGGAHNWGNEAADFGADAVGRTPAQPSSQAAADQQWPATTGPDGEEAVQRKESSTEEAPAAPEEPKTLSLDAYRAACQEKRAHLPAAKEAEAAEEDKQKLLQDGYQIYTKEEQPAVGAKKRTAEDGSSSDDNRKPRTMHLAEVAGVNLSFRGRRGGRRENSNQRPQKSNSAAVKEINLSDQQAFPTLQAH